MLPFVLVLALIWGIGFALFLHYVPIGRFMVRRHTWLTLVIGIGVDLALMWMILPLPYWLVMAGILAASSIGMIGHSLAMESEESEQLLEVLRNAAQTDHRQQTVGEQSNLGAGGHRGHVP